MGRCETGVGMTNNVDEFLDFISEFNLVEPECIHQTIRCLLDDLRSDPRRKPYASRGSRCQISRSNTCQPLPKERCTVLSGGNASCSARPLPMVLPSNALDIGMDHDRLRGDRGACLLPVMLALVETMPHQPTGHEF